MDLPNLKYSYSFFGTTTNIRYYTITDVCTTVLLPTIPSSDDDSAFRRGFGAEASLSLAHSAPAVSHDFVRLLSLNGIDISTLMLLELYLGSFPCIIGLYTPII